MTLATVAAAALTGVSQPEGEGQAQARRAGDLPQVRQCQPGGLDRKGLDRQGLAMRRCSPNIISRRAPKPEVSGAEGGGPPDPMRSATVLRNKAFAQSPEGMWM